MLSLTQAIVVAHACEARWQAELENTFGRGARAARYSDEGEGKPGTALARAYRRRSESLRLHEIAFAYSMGEFVATCPASARRIARHVKG